jgi:tetratricopeptide (TPR) repeat protein
MTYLSILLIFAAQSHMAAGRASYQSGEFSQAAAQFERALRTNPASAESHYWLGRSYETLADIATPFGRKYRSLARTHLTRAAELAPARSEYRRELLEFLLDAGDQRQAFAILVEWAESGPEYDYMLSRVTHTQRLNASFNARICKLFGLATAWH